MQTRNLVLLSVLTFVVSCGEIDRNNAINPAAKNESAENDYINSADSTSFSSPINDITSPSRKIIRKADLRCRVDDVLAATTRIEHLVTSAGGMVQESAMQNEINQTKLVQYKLDSLKNVREYTTTSYLTVRVPHSSLDTVITAIAGLSSFIDHRTLSQTDVTLRYLSNALKNKNGNSPADSKAVALARKTNEAIAADEYHEQKEEHQIDRKIENLRLLDDASYATISIAFYQPEKINTAVVMNPDHFTRPAFGIQFTRALTDGWQVMMTIFIFLVRLWPLAIMVLVGLITYKKLIGKPLPIKS